MRRIQFIISLVFAVVSCETKKPPNIVILMADDLGYGDIGAFGNTTIRTPNIDQLAQEGLKLTHHLTPSPACTPSRAAFLTGRYPSRMGLAANVNSAKRVIHHIASTSGIPPNETTFAELAKRSGYKTAYIGKWHLGSHCTDSGDFCHHPMKKGFDYFYGCLLTFVKDFSDHFESITLCQNKLYFRNTLITTICALVVMAAPWYFGLIGNRTMKILFIVTMVCHLFWQVRPYFLYKLTDSVLHRNFESVEQPIRFENLTQRLVWESVEFLEKKRETEDPFLLYVSWFHVHTPLYNSVPEFRGRSRHGEYGDNVEEMDWSVGEILKALDRLHLSENTLVLFTSDNGGHVEEEDFAGRRAGGFNGPWRGGKTHGGWDGGYRVPTVIRWPGVVPPGSVSDEPSVNTDIFPTLAAVMQQSVPTGVAMDGVSLMPILKNPKASRNADVPLGERFIFQYCGDQIFAVRWRRVDGVWKLRLASPPWLPGTERCDFMCPCFEEKGAEVYKEPKLYYLNDDPEERRPMDTRVEAHAEVRRLMVAAVEEHRHSIAQVPSQFDFGKVMWRPWLQPCCNFPFCRCKDTKWVRT